jgi:hypothetical protein
LLVIVNNLAPLKHDNLILKMKRNMTHTKDKIQVPKLTGPGVKSMVIPQEIVNKEEGRNYVSFMSKELNDAKTPRSLISLKHSVLSGIED